MKQPKKVKQNKPKKIKNKYALRTDLILWSVGILLLFMGIQSFISRILVQNFAVWEKEQQMQYLMGQLVNNYSDDTMEIYRKAELYQDVENIRIMIFDDDELIYHSSSVENAPPRESSGVPSRPSGENIPDSIPDTSPNPSGSRQNSGNFNSSNSISVSIRRPNEIPSHIKQEVDRENVVTLETTFDYMEETRTIMLWSSVVAIDSAVNLFTKVNIGVSCLVIFWSVLGVMFFSRRFTQPLTNMEKVAEAVSNFDFSNKAEENVRTRELTHLAQSINIMSDNLEEMFAQLNQDNETLSNKVENQEKLEQMRRQFVANISHEMKTPLSMLMMYSESLKLDIPDVDKEFYYDTIIQEATGLNAMVEQLLDTSAVENGLATVHLQRMNFSEFLEEIQTRLSPLLAEYHCSFLIEPSLFIQGDRKYLEQAVRNFITNAIAHTEKGGTITVSLKKEGTEVRYSVENQGKPVPKEDIPYLWDSFYRGDKSRTNSGEMTEKRVGLGLYIVKTCVSSHFGSVFVENREDSVLFSFTVPVCEDKED